MSLLKGFSILFIFSENQLLDSLILRIVLLVSTSFNSALILVISFLLLALGCLCCCSLSFCRRRVRLVVWNVSNFFRWACIAMNFPLRTALAVSHKFWVVVSSFSFVSRNLFFKIFYLFIFRERREGERERERHQCAVPGGYGLQPRNVPWLGIEPGTLWFPARAQSTELCQPGLRNLLISSLISFLTHSLFNSMLFNLHDFEWFGVFSLGLISSFRSL
ncbi:hypothetical protein HJG60_011958 [Phyllostomus discolor]|uniref:Uncharacterized protein n=1 Tax=Phyllostomus discolor TaxID=89673 RepID=A0A833ZJ09_9CHIR|nr:hypothetical protein HJG60_011958 [Phyllostomus discolor]